MGPKGFADMLVRHVKVKMGDLRDLQAHFAGEGPDNIVVGL